MSSIKDAYNTVRQLGRFRDALAVLEPALKDVADLEAYKDELSKKVGELKVESAKAQAELDAVMTDIAKAKSMKDEVEAAVASAKASLRKFVS
jgi:phage shock protein A